MTREHRPYPKPTRHRRQTGARSRAQVERVRPDVYERDAGQCVCAGTIDRAGLERWRCAGARTIQHAKGKGAGGSYRNDDPELLRTMCAWHNTLETADATFARWCRWWGWSLRRLPYGTDPATVPVRYPDGRDYLLGPGLALSPVSRQWAYARRVELYGADAEPTI